MRVAVFCIIQHVNLVVTALQGLHVLLPRRDLLAHTQKLVSAVVFLPNNTEANHYERTTTIPLRSVESAAQANSLGPMVLYSDPILRRTISPVTGFGPSIEKVADLLVAGMQTNATTALQYGIDARIMVLKGPSSPLPHGKPLVLINPTVLTRSSEDKMVVWKEYCGVLSPPSSELVLVEIDLLRDEVVEVAAQDIRGVPVRKALNGEAARAFQHELDHLEGLLILDHAGLEDMPSDIAKLEAPYHLSRQRKAFERKTYQGNTPLYY
jgi:peptide deformylase